MSSEPPCVGGGDNSSLDSATCSDLSSSVSASEERNGDTPVPQRLRINVPEFHIQKVASYPKETLVWDIKQATISALPKVSLTFFQHRSLTLGDVF